MGNSEKVNATDIVGISCCPEIVNKIHSLGKEKC